MLTYTLHSISIFCCVIFIRLTHYNEMHILTDGVMLSLVDGWSVGHEHAPWLNGAS